MEYFPRGPNPTYVTPGKTELYTQLQKSNILVLIIAGSKRSLISRNNIKNKTDFFF